MKPQNVDIVRSHLAQHIRDCKELLEWLDAVVAANKTIPLTQPQIQQALDESNQRAIKTDTSFTSYRDAYLSNTVITNP